MPELFIQALRTDDAGAEEPAVTRERLKEIFPKLASRRMTQLGLVLGSTLLPLSPAEADALIYASEYAETRALEGYLDSFPSASPTLFQTSIHPSAVQQALIGRQQPVREFFPVTGHAHLVVRALQTASLTPAPRALLCGGEERGTWLLERGTASARTFAFSLALTRNPTPETLARITLTPLPETPPTPADPLRHGVRRLDAAFDGPARRSASDPSASDSSSAFLSTSAFPTASASPVHSDAPATLSLPDFFDALHQRRPLDLPAAPGLRLVLAWS